MTKNRIFISYSHRGSGPQWKAALLRALHVFERHHLLDVWEDGKIRVSSAWDDDISKAMSNARLAVVLLTREALESEYIRDVEFPFLRERQQRDELPVFPVICEACDWRAHEWLRTIQAPNQSNPISQLSPAMQERVFRKLATDIADELSSVTLNDFAARSLVGGEIADVSGESEAETYLDRFPLSRSSGLREEKLIGREQEIALLDLAFAQPQTAIVSLVAWGGVGKTMLVQYWLQRLQRDGWLGARRVYAWSFFSQGAREDRQASEDTFLAHALEWFGVQFEPKLSPWDKGRLLADAIVRERTLFILDGIEPLQYPPGPVGGQLRAPGMQSMLKQLARVGNNTEHGGLCLVTTREPLADLADFERRPNAPWGSVLRLDFGNLTEEAGAALLHHAGAKRVGAAEINEEDSELLAASREVDGHALTLNLLGRFIARAYSGDIRQRDLVNFDEADRREQGGTTFKMLGAFERWFARSGESGSRRLAVLRLLGLFDRPADTACLDSLRSLPVIPELTDSLFIERVSTGSEQESSLPLIEEDWNEITSYLRDFSLITIQISGDGREGHLDCHPLIREYFGNQLREKNSEAWCMAHERLYEYLKNSVEARPDTLEGLQPLFQSVFHGCEAKLHSKALDDVYFGRIERQDADFSTHVLGAHDSIIAMLRSFFGESWSHPHLSLTEGQKAYILSVVSYELRHLARTGEAMQAAQAGLEIDQGRRNWTAAGVDAGNLSELHLEMGHLNEALDLAKQAVDFAERSYTGPPMEAFGAFGMRHRSKRDVRRQRTAIAIQANVLFQLGRSEAELLFQQAEELQKQVEPQNEILYGLQGYWYCLLLLSQRKYSEVSQRASRSLDICRRLGWPQDWGLCHLSLAEANFFRIEHTTSESFSLVTDDLEQAYEHLRGSRNALPLVLMFRARLSFLSGQSTDAQADLNEAWEIAERGPLRLHLIDIHLHRARLFFRERPYPWKSPQDDLAAAEHLINDCGYHRRDEELADARRVILGESRSQ